MAKIGSSTIPKAARTNIQISPDENPQMTTHILFDFFGTLVEYSASRTEQGYERSFDVLRLAGSRLDYDAFLSLWSEVSADFEEVANRTHHEFTMLEVADAFLERAGVRSPSETVNEFVSAYIAEWNTGVRPIAGLPVMLAGLNKKYSLSVITNTHDPKLVPDHLAKMGIATHFDHVITSVEFGLRKPSAKIFEHALGLLDATANECLYVGDNYEADYLGARSAGIQCLLIDPRRESPVDPADRLDSIFDLTRALKAGHPD